MTALEIVMLASSVFAAVIAALTPAILWCVRVAKQELSVEVVKIGIRLAELEMRSNSMWEAQLRRGLSEGLSQGLLEKNSPVKITIKAKELFVHLVDDLRAFYATQPVGMSDADLAMVIEQKFGNRITNEICIPQKLVALSCLVVAVAVAKGVDEVEIVPDVIDPPT